MSLFMNSIRLHKRNYLENYHGQMLACNCRRLSGKVLISDPNMFKISKFGAYEFNFVLQASHAVVLSKWRRNAWQTPETSAWETNLVLINWISYYIFKGLFLQHSVQQTTLTNHDPHGNQHWRICRRILVYTFCLINIVLSLSDEHESRGGSSDFRLPTSDFRLRT